MWIRSREQEVRARHDEALALLDAGDLDGAKRIAHELRALGWSGAFEVLALAMRAERDLAGAVQILDEGCALAPASFGLHELRGSMLDALGEHARAIEAYDRALECEGAWTASIHYNRSITRLRIGDAGGALVDAEQVLSGAVPPPFAIDAVRVAIDALDRLGRHEDAVSLVRTVLAETERDGAIAGRLKPMLALTLSRAGDVERARAAALDAIEDGHGNAELASLMPPPRHDERAPQRWRLVVEGAWPSDPKVGGFYRVVSVLAADEDEALAWARLLEPAGLRAVLRVHEITRDDGAASGEVTRGVVGASGRVFF